MSSRTEHSHFGDEEHPDEVYDQEWIEDPHPVDDGEPIDEHVVHEDLVHEEPVHEDDGLHADLLGEPEHVEMTSTPGTRRLIAPDRSQARVGTPPPARPTEGSSGRSLPLIALAVIVALGFGAYKVIVPKLTGVFSNSAEDYSAPAARPRSSSTRATPAATSRELIAGVITDRRLRRRERQDPDAAA